MQVVVAKSPKQKEDAFSVRRLVFVEEQKVPVEEELDAFDEVCDHFVLYDHLEPVGAGRFRSLEGNGKVERICVIPSYRKKGAGAQLMKAIEEHAIQNGYPALKLNAQTHALSFYERLGYHITSDEFLDAGIPHKSMEKYLKKT
ncbi:GNAT family N-acetyltransferase [Jeotgalibacillus proteolyticus]|uniref:GNAT family N-acetyltransferase n=1 Tax=Jeotgalibacillus proteolyticus TaxID=2082395 RepID=A0A2S5GHA6_9BACL|nr:GNAT family N-acetyltransferase [Jeotgalibacillus proteolyticus]PPA72304.1 GNAT family N-acetyltransferase [Jeotgalibacillus proteolyticus]